MIRSLQCKACLPLVLAIAPGLFAQAKSDPDNSLKIAVLQGEGAVHNVRTGAVTQPVVEVRDESFKPVFGAEVTFEVPATGPGGTFGGSTTYTGKTNAQGQIGAPFTPNNREGRYYIRVTATQGGRTGSTRIAQTNSTLEFSSGEPVKRERSKAWKVLLGVGSAAVVPVILLARRGGSDNNGSTNGGPPTVTLSPGSVSVGGPR